MENKHVPTTMAKSGFSLVASNFEEAMKIATMLAGSKLVPTQYQGHPEDVLIACSWGESLGLKPLPALNAIAVINGRPQLFGDALKALIMKHGTIEEHWDNEKGVWTMTAHRNGHPDVTWSYGYNDAIAAGHVSYNPQNNTFGLGARKSDAWAKNPKRMCQMRCRAFVIRDAFPDVLQGINIEGDGYDEIEQPETVGTEPVTEVKALEQKQAEQAELMEQMSNVQDVSEVIDVEV